MKPTDAVTASVEVAVEPAVAFAIFTEEIGQWWRPGPINWYDSERAIGTRIEPGVGGRWIEVYDDAAGDVLEIGRVLVWEPGERLVLAYRDGGHELDGTEVEVRFETIDGGTRVTLEHRGWEKLRADIAVRKRTVKRWGWADKERGATSKWHVCHRRTQKHPERTRFRVILWLIEPRFVNVT